MEHTTVLRFWFEEVDPRKWWKSEPDSDMLIARRYGEVHAHAEPKV